MHLWQYLFRYHKSGFPGQQEGEVVEFYVSRHWIVFIPLFFLFLVFIAGLLFFNYVFLSIEMPFDDAWIYVADSIFLTILAHTFSFLSLNAKTRLMLVTNRRVLRICSTVFLHRERNVVHFHNIQDIEMFQSGVFPRLFNYGEIILTSASGEYDMDFHFVLQTQKIYNLLSHIYGDVHDRKPLKVQDKRSLSESRNLPHKQKPDLIESSSAF